MNFKLRIEKTSLTILIASICLLISAFSWWLSTPLQSNISGYSIPLFGSPLSVQGFNTSFKVISFGTASILLFVLCVFFYSLKSLRKILFFVGMLGIALSMFFMLKLAFLDFEQIYVITYQQDQYNNILQFSQQFMYDTNTAQDSPTETIFRGPFDRFIYSFHWISIGLYANFIAGLLLTFASRRFFKGMHKKILIGLLAVYLLLALILCKNIIISEIYLVKAEKYLFSGFTSDAIESYEKAGSLNPDLIKNFSYAYQLGYAHYLNRDSSYIVHFFEGENFSRIRNFRESLSELNTSQSDKALQEVLSKEKVTIFTAAGMGFFKNKQTYAAIPMFMDSTYIDPWQSQSRFF